MKKKQIIICLYIVISLFSIHTIRVSYNNFNIINKQLIESALTQAIKKDKEIRMNQINAPIWIGSIRHDTSEYTTIEQENKPTIKLKRNNELKEKSRSEKIDLVIQSFLHDFNPIKINNLDSLFNIELQKNNLNARSSVSYINGTSYITSSKEKMKGTNIIITDTLYDGIQKEISFVGYAEIPISNYLIKEKSQLISISFIWIILTVFSLSIRLIKRKDSSIQESIDINAERFIKSNKSTNLSFYIADYLSFDKENNLIIYNKKQIRLTSQSGEILCHLLESPDHFLTYEELIQKLWYKVELNGQERLTQAIKRLRENLKDCPIILIENIRKEGYRLLINYDNSLFDQKNKFTIKQYP